jgi:hypothetical protein
VSPVGDEPADILAERLPAAHFHRAYGREISSPPAWRNLASAATPKNFASALHPQTQAMDKREEARAELQRQLVALFVVQLDAASMMEHHRIMCPGVKSW